MSKIEGAQLGDYVLPIPRMSSSIFNLQGGLHRQLVQIEKKITHFRPFF